MEEWIVGGQGEYVGTNDWMYKGCEDILNKKILRHGKLDVRDRKQIQKDGNEKLPPSTNISNNTTNSNISNNKNKKIPSSNSTKRAS